MIGKLSREEIIHLLSKKPNRERIISFVFNQAKITLFEIGMNNAEIWEICACGSYFKPDPEGRWPRIVLPWYPEVFVPQTYRNKRHKFVYRASDFDATVLTNDKYGPKENFLTPIENKTNIKESLKNFTKKTGVELRLLIADGFYELGAEKAHEGVFGYEEYEVVYKHQ